MQQTQLGSTGIAIAPLAFGANVFGWTVDEAASFSLLDALVERGIDFIDTADIYSSWKPGNTGGDSETIIGKWLARSGKRDRIVLSTKVGMWQARPGLSATNIATAVEESLVRLKTDYVDVCFAHIDDASVDFDETLGAFDKLVSSGKVKVIGASNYGAARTSEAIATSRRLGLATYQVLQPEYNLMERVAYETGLEPMVLEEGLGVLSYYSLASGFLSGKYRTAADLSGSARKGRVQAYMTPRGSDVLAALDRISAARGISMAAVALAWVMSRKSITAPIASATSIAQLDELLVATDTRLSAEEVQVLDLASRVL